MRSEAQPDGDWNLLLNRLIEGESDEVEIAEIENLLREEPAALDAYFDLLETHAMLRWRLGTPPAQAKSGAQAGSALGVDVGNTAAVDFPSNAMSADAEPADPLPAMGSCFPRRCTKLSIPGKSVS